MKRLEYWDIDLTVNPMDVSDLRVGKFDMTQPYFISSIGVATYPGATATQRIRSAIPRLKNSAVITLGITETAALVDE